MRTTIELLNAVKRQHKLQSDYALAKHLGLTRAAISRYMSGQDSLGEIAAIRVAAALDIDPGVVFAIAAGDRTRDAEAKKVWQAMAKRLTTAALALMASVPLGSPSPAEAASNQSTARAAAGPVFILLNHVNERNAPHRGPGRGMTCCGLEKRTRDRP